MRIQHTRGMIYIERQNQKRNTIAKKSVSQQGIELFKTERMGVDSTLNEAKRQNMGRIFRINSGTQQHKQKVDMV